MTQECLGVCVCLQMLGHCHNVFFVSIVVGEDEWRKVCMCAQRYKSNLYPSWWKAVCMYHFRGVESVHVVDTLADQQFVHGCEGKEKNIF